MGSRQRWKRLAQAILVGGAVAFLVVVGVHLGPLRDGDFTLELYCLLCACAALGLWQGQAGVGRATRVVAAVGLSVVAASALLIQANGRVQHMGTNRQVAEWGVFHYYLGGKYFSEMGYLDLYAQAVIADWDGGRGPKRFEGVERVRDLRTYGFVSSAKVRKMQRSPAWTDARWEEFKRDVRWFGHRAGPARWRKILSDRGYNPPPSYVLVAGTLENLLSIRHPVSQTLLVAFDLLLLLAALALSVRAYGYARSILVLVAFLVWYGNVNRVFGQIWILDWFAACWMAVSAWKLGLPALSGGLVAYAACVRVFPGVLLLGPIVAGLPGIVRQRSIPPRLLRFVGTAAVVAIVMVGGSALRYGLSSWKGFVDHISEHNEHHVEGNRRFGLQQVFVLDWKSGLSTSADDLRGRRNLRANKAIYRLSAVFLIALGLLAMARGDEHDAMLAGLVVFFAATVASRYYGAVMVLLLLLACGRPPPGRSVDGERPLCLRIMDAGIMILIWAVYAAPWGDEPRLQYAFSNAAWAAWWVILLALLVFGPGLRAGREGEPDAGAAGGEEVSPQGADHVDGTTDVPANTAAGCLPGEQAVDPPAST